MYENYDRKQLIALLEEMQKRRKEPVDLSSLCFPQQESFLKDTSPFVTAVTSRRAGKTTACAYDLLTTASYSSDVVVLYITLARINASRIIWPILKKLNQESFLGGVANETTLSMRFPNNSIIYCSGAKDLREVDKFLGLPIKLAYIDEAQSFRSYLTDLIDRVLAPALLDHAGSLKLIGTPSPLPTGTFWEMSQSSQWSHHEWNFFSNPWIASKSGLTHQDLLDRELKRRGVALSNPTIQREFFGKWVHDSDVLVFRYDRLLNDYIESPKGNYVYVMGVDLGYEDCDAISVLGWTDESKITYLFEEKITAKQGLTELIKQIEDLRVKYNICKIVMDTGGLGKKIGEEVIRRYQLPVEPAEKIRKHEYIELFNDALRTGRFKARSTSRFAQDAMLVEWDLDKSTPDKRVVSDRFHSDICDSVLYAWRCSYSFASEAPIPRLTYGTEQWAKAEAERMEDEAEAHFKKLEERDGFGIL